MTTPNIKITGSLDDADVIRGLETETRAIRKEIEALQKLSGESKKTGQAQEERGRKAMVAFSRPRRELERFREEQRRLNADLKEGAITQAQFNRGLENARSRMVGVGAEAAKGRGEIVRFVRAFAGIGGVVGSLRMLIGEVKRQIESVRREQKKVLTAQESFAPAFANAAASAGGLLTPEEFKKRFEQLEKNAPTADPTALANSLTGTISSVGATGKRDIERAFRATRAAANFIPLQGAEAQGELAATSASLSKKLNITPTQAIGLIQRTGVLSNIRNPAMIARNVAPTVAGLVDFGFNKAEAGGLVSAITQGADDVTGEASRTAAINFARKLEKFRKQTGREGGETIGQTLRAMQDDPKLRKLFFEGGTAKVGGKTLKVDAASPAEARFVPTIRSLAGGSGGQIATQFRQGTKAIGGLPQFEKAVADREKFIRNLDFAQGPLTAKIFRASAKRQRTRNIKGGKSGAIREGIQDNLESVGADQTTVNFVLGKLDFLNSGKLDTQQAIDVFERRANRLRPAAEGGSAAEFAKLHGLDPEQIAKNVKAMDELTATLREFNETMKQQQRREPAARPRQVPAQNLGRQP